jgi:4a-hydroxytetrahydrobiopterin dehydratase
MPALLTGAELAAARSALPAWEIGPREMQREFRFTSYLGGVAFVNEIAAVAEDMNHHPDIHIGWRKVTVRISTHSAGGLTALDTDFARRADEVFQRSAAA